MSGYWYTDIVHSYQIVRPPIALPHARVLREYFELDPNIPHGLRWKTKAARNTIIGDPAGRRHVNGYWEVRFQTILYKSSRIIYKIYNNGEDPGLYEIDHLDRNKDNNDGSNLILATRADQNRNKTVTSASGFRHVSIDLRPQRESAPWVANVSFRLEGERMNKYLGYFSNPYEAAIAAIVYKRENNIRYEYAPGGAV
jgi:hypothetical protein